MTRQHDTSEQELYDAARAVKVAVRTAQAQDWPHVALENDGGYAEAPELQAALDKLCAVVDEVNATERADVMRRAADRDREAAAQAKVLAAGGSIAEALEPAALPAITVLHGDMRDTIYGIRGIALMLDRHGGDYETDMLASGLVTLARALETSLGTLPCEVSDALDALDPVAKVYP